MSPDVPTLWSKVYMNSKGWMPKELIYLIIYIRGITMTKKITPQNNHANQKNANKGQVGVNEQYAKVHGNKGQQKNPNNK